ncbi:MAG: hypothetical protein M3O07_11715, partial [Pseudomonadota bacterium]|nr:hypothetical protein [Pseudomonadota bacterium]
MLTSLFKVAACNAGRRATAFLLAACLLPAAYADPWLEPGDARLRHDLQLLADAGIVRAPLTTWPVSWPEIARDVGEITGTSKQPLHVEAALARV